MILATIKVMMVFGTLYDQAKNMLFVTNFTR
jgi:hypothetical protein